MRLKFLIIGGLAAITITLIQTPKNTTYFIPFDEAQIQDHYSPNELINFYQRFRKKRWKTLDTLYKTHLAGRKKHRKKEKIPKIIHQIWLGSPLPEKYKQIQQTWIAAHPEWEYHLWTDEDVDLLFLKNRALYEAAIFEIQKSDILRFEILSQYGGIYVDIDFECFKSFDILVENCDFFAGALGTIHTPEIGTAIIGASIGHPIIGACINALKDQHASTTMEEMLETSGPPFLTRVFFDSVNRNESGANVILPSSYFYPIPQQKRNTPDHIKWIRENTFAVHYWNASWLK